MRWLRVNDVLLPGITTPIRLIARVRDEATQRLWDTLGASVTVQQRAALDVLLEVPSDDPGVSVVVAPAHPRIGAALGVALSR